MKAICQGNIYSIYNDTLKTYDQLPAQFYTVRFSKGSGFFLEHTPSLEIKEGKVYGVHEAKCDKVLGNFKNFSRNLGAILSGDKGIGKSLFAKLLSIKAIANGYPVIIVDKYIPGIASYIAEIEQECLILFDEFDKTFGDVNAEDGMAPPQTELLTLFDGLTAGKKLFVITCNSLNKINEFLVNRPGRFHYHFRFEYPMATEIQEYMKDKLPESAWGEIDKVISFSKKVKLNYDCLRAIAYELSTGLSFSEAIVDLNIVNTEQESYQLTLHYENGITAVCPYYRMDIFNSKHQSAWLGDGIGTDYVRVFFHTTSIKWDDTTDKIMVPASKLRLDYYRADEDEHEELALIESVKDVQPLYLTIERTAGKGIHYLI